MGFWDGEKCEYCKGSIIEKTVDLPRKLRGKYFLIKKVPVGICKECGTRYYTANVLKSIETIIRTRKKAEKEVSMAVYSLQH